MQIRLTVDGQTATAHTRRQSDRPRLASLLPMTLNMHDLFGREKPRQLPRPLTRGEGQSTYQVADVGYWAPSHDLAIFYADDGQTIPSPGIVIIGWMDSGLDIIADAGGSFQLTIDRLA